MTLYTYLNQIVGSVICYCLVHVVPLLQVMVPCLKTPVWSSASKRMRWGVSCVICMDHAAPLLKVVGECCHINFCENFIIFVDQRSSASSSSAGGQVFGQSHLSTVEVTFDSTAGVYVRSGPLGSRFVWRSFFILSLNRLGSCVNTVSGTKYSGLG